MENRDNEEIKWSKRTLQLLKTLQVTVLDFEIRSPNQVLISSGPFQKTSCFHCVASLCVICRVELHLVGCWWRKPGFWVPDITSTLPQLLELLECSALLFAVLAVALTPCSLQLPYKAQFLLPAGLQDLCYALQGAFIWLFVCLSSFWDEGYGKEWWLCYRW